MKVNKKVLGILVPIVTLGVSALGNWWANESQKDEIKKQVAEEFAKLNKGDA